MKRVIALSCLFLMLIMVMACGGSATPEPTATPTSAPPTPTDEPSTVEESPETADESTTSNDSAVSEAACEPIDIPNDPNILPVGEDEWVKGPEDATITFVEYADFQ